MYYTATQLRLSSERELASMERKGQLRFPRPYREFMKRCGVVICIDMPDFDVLRTYAECDFWEYEGAPIAREHLYECVVIAHSIDGDYIAVHAKVKGYILLPGGSGLKMSILV